MAAKKLRPYFQAHPIVVLTNLPLRGTIHKPDLSRRMARWAIELSEFNIQYKSRLALKGQELADFLVELPQLNTDQGNVDWWILKQESELACNLKPRLGKGLNKPYGWASLCPIMRLNVKQYCLGLTSQSLYPQKNSSYVMTLS